MSVGPNIIQDGLVFGYDADDRSRFYAGEPTTNYVANIISGTSATYSKPTTIYQVSANVIDAVDETSPIGSYSQYVGDANSINQQVWWNLTNNGLDFRNSEITISIWLKGSGTCFLNIYSDVNGYGSSSTITLNDTWTRYSYTRTIGNYTSSAWAGVRGILSGTTVSMAGVQIELKDHETQFTETSRSNTEALFDLVSNTTIDLTNISFNGGDLFFDNNELNYIDLGTFPELDSGDITIDFWAKIYNANVVIGKHYNNFEIRIEPTYFGGYIGHTSGWREINDAQVVHGANYASSYNNYTYVISYTDNNIKFYTNNIYKGLLDGATLGITMSHYTTGGELSIGRRAAGNSSFFHGKLPILKIYNRVLSANEIQQNYNVTKGRFQ